MKKHLCILTGILCAGILISCSKQVVQVDYGIIPLPQKVTLTDQEPYLLKPASVTIGYPENNPVMKRNAEFLAEYLTGITGKQPKLTAGEGNITLLVDAKIQHPEGYELTVSKDAGIQIVGGSEAGVFYGIQTLRKSLPAEAKHTNVELPSVSINDYPRFGYRGMHLDVSRHFFPADSVKTYIDILALHNLNKFHWHLSDDQGWRIEIKKYPELTKISSKRSETVIGHNTGKYDGKEYGPFFYTQDEIRDIIAYAAERHITIIPEIDLPGHQQAALAAYPDLGCTGGPYEVWRQWGISDNVICAGNDKALEFLEDVLAEVIELFPSEYIHIGGDECPKTKWEKCPKCQARIQALRITGNKSHSKEEYLQSYVIKRMEQFVESKGRHIIGWDEILEGGLAPNATVMSWRGTAGGIEAAKMGHNVVMTPHTHLYFDYYQSTDTENEPMGIGGYVPLEKVYSFDPLYGIPQENQKYVIGVQANVWTEYIPTFRHVEYMILPRIDALAEVQWTEPESKKDYRNFLSRVARMTRVYDHLGYNYAKHIFDVNAVFTPNTANNTITVTLSSFGDGDIHYTLDGTEPTAKSPKYAAPAEIGQPAEFRAVVIRPGTQSRLFKESVTFNKATAKPVTLKEQPSRGYTFQGAPTLADGLRGTANYKTGRWLGFQGRNMDAVIDLQQTTEISKVYLTTNVVKGDWIMGSTGLTVKVSDDGQNFREVASKKIPELGQRDKDGLYPHEITFAPVKGRYVEVIAHAGRLPKWHSGAGAPAYIFVDEIGIE